MNMWPIRHSMPVMDALHAKELNYVLEDLGRAIKGLSVGVDQEVTITCYDTAEDMGGYIVASKSLVDNLIVRRFKEISHGEKYFHEHPDDTDDSDDFIPHNYFIEIKFWLKPKVLIDYLVETSRIPKYTLALDNRRRLIINDKYILTTLHFNSPNFYFFDYALKNSGLIRKDALKATAGNIGKRFHTVLEQVIKNGELIKLFFPNVAKDVAEFRNFVRINDIRNEGINENSIKRHIKTLRTVSSNSHI